MTIGFIGQGFIGKNYADDFERRGYATVRYSLEAPYRGNKDKIKECDVVFIAVPAATTPQGFDDSIIRTALSLVGVGKVAVIKSTTLPGMVKQLQKDFPNIVVLHSPEFLTEKNAAHDAANPTRNIIGIPRQTSEYEAHARTVLSVLPKAPYEHIADSTATELIKYASNTFLYMKVLYANIFYDLAQSLNVDYDSIREAVAADPRIGGSHLRVVDTSGHQGATPGRGAGGHCFIKDFAALRQLYAEHANDAQGLSILTALEAKNNELLKASNKDLDLLRDVYGTV